MTIERNEQRATFISVSFILNPSASMSVSNPAYYVHVITNVFMNIYVFLF